MKNHTTASYPTSLDLTPTGGLRRDELLNSWHFDSLPEARVMIEDRRHDHNADRPYSAHGELTPSEFALQWTRTHQPQVA